MVTHCIGAFAGAGGGLRFRRRSDGYDGACGNRGAYGHGGAAHRYGGAAHRDAGGDTCAHRRNAAGGHPRPAYFHAASRAYQGSPRNP